MQQGKKDQIIAISLFTLFTLLTSVIAIRQKQSTGLAATDGFFGDIIVDNDLAYGKLPLQKLDLCEPKNISGKVPGVILIHGGGGDKSDYSLICRQLAKQGLVAIAVNFREGPPPAYKVILPDNRDALSWLKQRPEVDPQRIAAMGGSLGGYVSSLLGTMEFPNKVNCVTNNFGPTDFTDPSFYQDSPAKQQFVDKFFGGVTYEEDPQLYMNLSPITHVSDQDPASWLFTRSRNDHLVPRSQMERMVEALKKVGISSRIYEYNGTGGGHANTLPSKEKIKLLDTQISFLVQCLSK